MKCLSNCHRFLISLCIRGMLCIDQMKTLTLAIFPYVYDS